MGKRKAIFLGNGFTRALVKNVPTWGQLIGCFNSSDAVQQTIPYTFQYEMNYLGGNKFEEETLKKEICSQLSVFSQVDLKDAAEKLLSFLTKNELQIF